MNSSQAFLILDRAGIVLYANGDRDRLEVGPATLLTAEVRALVCRFKRELLCLTRAAEQEASEAVFVAVLSSALEQRHVGGRA